MANTLMSILIALGLDTKEYDSALKDAEGKAKAGAGKIGSAFSSVGASMTKVGGIMTATVTAPIVMGAMKAVDAASDLSETVSKVGVVFGDSADEVLAFGETAATALGMSKNEALSAAGTYGNLFRAMGMTEDVSADMSTSLVTLAGDLASFNNMDPTEVLDKLRAGLSGETEPLKSLGVNLNQAAVEAKALTMGLGTTTADMTKVSAAADKLAKAQGNLNSLTKGFGADSQQAQDALIKLNGANLDLEQSQLAAANAAKKFGADSIQARQAQQTMEEKLTASTKAQELYNLAVSGYGPESEEVQSAMAAVEQAQGNLNSAMAGGKTTLNAAEKAQATYALVLEQTSLAQGDFTRTSTGLANQQRILKAQFSDLSAQLGTILLPIVTQLVGFLSKVVAWFMTLSPEMQKTIVIVLAVAAAIGPLLVILGTLLSAIGAISTFLAGPAAAAIGAAIAAAAPVLLIIAAIIAVLALLYAAWQSNFLGIQDITAVVIEYIVGRWNDFLSEIQAVWSWLQTVLFPFFQALASLITAVVALAVRVLQDEWKKLLTAIEPVWNFIKSSVMPLFKEFSDWLNSTFGESIKKAADAVRNIFAGAFEWVSQKIQEATEWINNLVDLINGLGGGSETPAEGADVQGVNGVFGSSASLSGGNTFNIFTADNPGTVSNALQISSLLGGAA